MIPFVPAQLVMLPASVSYLGFALVALAAFQEVRSGHIGRIALVGNVFLLWQVFYLHWTQLPPELQVYLNVGTVLAIVGLFTYLIGSSLPSLFYRGVFVLFGSISVVIVLWFGISTGFA